MGRGVCVGGYPSSHSLDMGGYPSMFLMVLMIWHIRTKYIRTVIDQTWVGVYVYVWGGVPLFVFKSP